MNRYNYAPKGVPNPYGPRVHNWKGGELNEGSLYHGPNYTRPVFSFPWKRRPYPFAAPPLSGLGDVDMTVNTRNGTFSNEGFGGGVFNLNTAFGATERHYEDVSDLNAPYDQIALQGIGGGSLGNSGMGVLGATKNCTDIAEYIVSLQNTIGQYMSEQAGIQNTMVSITNDISKVINEENRIKTMIGNDPGQAASLNAVLIDLGSQKAMMNSAYAKAQRDVAEISEKVVQVQAEIAQKEQELVSCKAGAATTTSPAVNLKVTEKPIVEPELTTKSQFPWELVVAGGIAAAVTGGLWYYGKKK